LGRRCPVQGLLVAAIQYVTNHLISRIPSYTVRHAWYHYVLRWYLGPDAAILMGQYVRVKRLRANGTRVSIGGGTVIDHDCLLYTPGGLLIGENVYISPGAWLLTASRDINSPQFTETHQPIVIDDYVWVGARAIILGGVTIGRRAIVQAGALVTQDLEPNSIATGVPARVVGTRELPSPSYSLNYRPLFE
jgi:acetyltransferase-like isoleucine patch superfamily enzyme